MNVSSDAQKVIDSAGAGAMNYINSQGGFGGKLTSGEATRLLTGFNPTITPQQVYSAGNIAQASTNPAPKPNYSDPFALRDYFMNTGDIVAARNAAKVANQDLLAARQTGRAQQQSLQELPQALNVIRGEQAVAGQQQSLKEQALAENLLAAQSNYDTFAQEANARYGIAQEQRNQIQGLITSTKGKAGISYADTYETALQKAAKWEKKTIAEAAKLAKKEAEKSTLKQLALTAGISTKGKNVKAIRSALEKKAKKDSDLNDQMNNLKLTAAQLDIANTKSIIANRGSEGEVSSTEAKTANENYIFDSLNKASKGSDGFVDPTIWKGALKDWTDAGGSYSEFVSKFKGTVDKKGKRKSGYINPNNL